jgi:tetratricopeptide (TPR) repeat protein
LQQTVPWERDVQAAVQKGTETKRLILACAFTTDQKDAESLVLSVIFADPDIVRLVKARFIPVLVRYDARLYALAEGWARTRPNPLEPLGLRCGNAKAPALVVSTPTGKSLSVLESIGTFDTGYTYRFLLDALAQRGAFSKVEGEKADALLAAGDLEGAEREFKKIRTAKKEYGLCRIAAMRGDHETALELARTVVRKKGNRSAEAKVQEGVSLMRLGRFKEAVQALRKASGRKSPRQAEALFYLGCLARLRKEAKRTEDLWKQVEKTDPHSLWALKASVYLKRADHFAFENLRSFPEPQERKGTERAVNPGEEMTLVEGAIGYLLDYQEPDGSWPIDPEKYRSAITAMAAHALTVWREDLKKDLKARAEAAVHLAVRWIEAYLSRKDPGAADSFGAATILDFFLHRYRKTKSAAAKNLAWKAVQFVLGGQETHGAWSYSRDWGRGWVGDGVVWPRTDKGRYHSMNTGPSLLFLLKAKEAGFNVDKDAIARAVKVLKEMRKSPGTYTYTYPIPRNFDEPHLSIGRGPVCEQALYLAEAVEKRDLLQTVDTFMKYRKDLRITAKLTKGWVPPTCTSSYFYFFAYYHGALAVKELGGDTARTMLQQLRTDLLAVPELDSTWVSFHQVGKAFGTASALLVLRMAREAK